MSTSCCRVLNLCPCKKYRRNSINTNTYYSAKKLPSKYTKEASFLLWAYFEKCKQHLQPITSVKNPV